jgi:hypothetical protein
VLTATVLNPNSLAALIILTAISERFAMSSLCGTDEDVGDGEREDASVECRCEAIARSRRRVGDVIVRKKGIGQFGVD